MNNFIFNEHNIPEGTDLTDDLVEFFKIDDSFCGWLLTLSESDFNHLLESSRGFQMAPTAKGVDDKGEIGFISSINLFKRYPVPGDKLDGHTYIEDTIAVAMDINLIHKYKKGLIEFRVDENGKRDFEHFKFLSTFADSKK